MTGNGGNSDRVPTVLVTIGGIAFLAALFILPWAALIGIADGVYILKKYPDKRIHGILPIVLNFLALLPTILFIFGVLH